MSEGVDEREKNMSGMPVWVAEMIMYIILVKDKRFKVFIII